MCSQQTGTYTNGINKALSRIWEKKNGIVFFNISNDFLRDGSFNPGIYNALRLMRKYCNNSPISPYFIKNCYINKEKQI